MFNDGSVAEFNIKINNSPEEYPVISLVIVQSLQSQLHQSFGFLNLQEEETTINR